MRRGTQPGRFALQWAGLGGAAAAVAPRARGAPERAHSWTRTAARQAAIAQRERLGQEGVPVLGPGSRMYRQVSRPVLFRLIYKGPQTQNFGLQ